jgi:hypothetical protein
MKTRLRELVGSEESGLGWSQSTSALKRDQLDAVGYSPHALNAAGNRVGDRPELRYRFHYRSGNCR